MRRLITAMLIILSALSTQVHAKRAQESMDRDPMFRRKEFSHFRTWLWNKLYYPYNRSISELSGEVVVQFVIEEDGAISSIEIIDSANEKLSKRVVRALNKAPKFSPALRGGKPVKHKTSLVITFRLTRKTKTVNYNHYRSTISKNRYSNNPLRVNNYNRNTWNNGNFNTEKMFNNSINDALYDFNIQYEEVSITKGIVIRDTNSKRAEDRDRMPESPYSVDESPRFMGNRPYVEYVDWLFKSVKTRSYTKAINAQKDNPLIISIIHSPVGDKPILNLFSTPNKHLARKLKRAAERAPALRAAQQDGVFVKYRGFIALTPARLQGLEVQSLSEEVQSAIKEDNPLQLRYVDKLPTYHGRPLKLFEDEVAKKARWNLPHRASGVGGSVTCKMTLQRDGTITNVEVVKSPHETLSATAVKAIEQMPNLWTPSEVYGKRVSSEIYISIPFDYR